MTARRHGDPHGEPVVVPHAVGGADVGAPHGGSFGHGHGAVDVDVDHDGIGAVAVECPAVHGDVGPPHLDPIEVPVPRVASEPWLGFFHRLAGSGIWASW